MSVEINEMPRKILELLYWEGQIDPTHLTVDKIREETELTDANIQDGLRVLHESGFIACNFIESDVRVSEAKISMKGIDKVKSLLNVEY
jgi:hypothetical protein